MSQAQLAIKNVRRDLAVTPGEAATFRIEDETYRDFSEAKMMLMANQICLRVPVWGEPGAVVVELSPADTLFPMPSTGYAICCWHEGEMHRVASGYLRRSSP